MTIHEGKIDMDTGDQVGPSPRGSTWNFVRHLFEMLAAMIAGMFLFGGLFSLVLLSLGESGYLSDHPSLRALVMTVNMTAGMALWMRYRGHKLTQITEMGAAMFVPLAILIYPFWAGAINRGALMGGMHMLMIPAMVGVMLYRRDVYTRLHGHQRATGSACAEDSAALT